MSKEKDTNTGTFVVKIINQQKSTWQGSVTWLEEQKTQNSFIGSSSWKTYLWLFHDGRSKIYIGTNTGYRRK